MEHGSIEQSIYIEASPDVVYEVVSRPEHITTWFVNEAEYEPVAGATGTFVFGAPATRSEVPMVVVAAEPGLRFSFRWLASPALERTRRPDALDAENSPLVTFQLTPEGSGTRLTVTESGMRELGWDAALLEHYHDDHSRGWGILLERLTARMDGEAGR